MVAVRYAALENMVMKKSFWADKKIFVTGHTGFKGSWLSLWLKQLGASVTGYALPPQTVPSLFELAKVANGMRSVEGNILDTEHLLQTIREQRPEIIFHLAAQPLVHYSYENPVETYMVNVMGTVNLLEAVRKIDSVKAVIVVTSDKCYENQEWVWGYRETDAMGGFDPYSSSKGCTELVVSAWRRSYFNKQVALATVRAGNVIGGGDWSADRLVPDLIRSFTRKETGIIRNPNASRPWQYILDVLQGYLKLAEKLWQGAPEFADAWNFGPDENNIKPVSWIADKLTSLWGNEARWTLDGKKYPHEATCLKLDSNKSRTVLGWMPKMTIDSALENTHAWYQAHHHQDDMEKFTGQQIEKYGI